MLWFRKTGIQLCFFMCTQKHRMTLWYIRWSFSRCLKYDSTMVRHLQKHSGTWVLVVPFFFFSDNNTAQLLWTNDKLNCLKQALFIVLWTIALYLTSHLSCTVALKKKKENCFCFFKEVFEWLLSLLSFIAVCTNEWLFSHWF